MHRWLHRSGALCVVLTMPTGCTLLGLGVGAALGTREGPFESHSAAERYPLTRRDRVRVHLRSGSRLDGTYAGTRKPTAENPEGYLLLELDAILQNPDTHRTSAASERLRLQTASNTVQPIPLSEIGSIDVEVSGHEWLYGGAIGLALDLTVATFVFVSIAQHH